MRLAAKPSNDSSGGRSGWALYGVVVTVSWIREANEASIGGLMVWWGWGGG